MSLKADIVNYLHFLSRILFKTNINHAMILVFLRYVLIKLKEFQKIQLKLQFLSDSVFQSILEKYFENSTCYIDPASCILGKLQCINASNPIYVNICSWRSSKKYKTLLVPFDKAKNNEIYISETTLFNIENLLASKNHSSYFILPACVDAPRWAEEAKISLIKNPNRCSQHLIDVLLKNYFSRPRFLRANDLISTSVENYAPQFLFMQCEPRLVYFRINSISLDQRATKKPCYIYRNKSKLMQEGSIHEYLPPAYSLTISEPNIFTAGEEIDNQIVRNVPPGFSKPLEDLRTSIMPFIMSDNWQGLRPIFLLQGLSGCGKYKLIDCLSQIMGFNFICVDCREIQTVSLAQTETKLRITMQNAENCRPCILKLSNIENIGRNSEGKIDERITANFTEQLDNIFKKNTKFPLVIIATLENGEICTDIGKNFIAKIHMTKLHHEEKMSLLEWFLKRRKMQHQADLLKIAGMCSDYVYSDMQTLILHAAKNSYKNQSQNSTKKLIIHHDDFTKACDYMKKKFSSRIGAVSVPEVHWDDIGGLTSLKHEIIRRIEIPLMTNKIQSSGILLYGPPGTGKTLLAKAVATECKLHFLSVKGPELLNMYVGQSEKNVRDIFEKARAASPCIIFFDELDALAPNRGQSCDSGGVMDRVVSQLLAEMDGLDSIAKIFIIAATNRPDLIDPALLRPGRFDKLLYVGIHSDPTLQLSILQAITRKFVLEGTYELNEIINKLPQNVTGADIHSVCSNAWLNAAQKLIEYYEHNLKKGREKLPIEEKPNGVVTVRLDDFLYAVSVLIPSVSDAELARYIKLYNNITSKKGQNII